MNILKDVYTIPFQQLDADLGELTASFEKATTEKLRCQQEAESTQLTISLANRLVGGLASENVRWAEAVGEFKKQVFKQIYLLDNTYKYLFAGKNVVW